RKRLELRQILGGRIATAHRTQDAVVSRLQRDVEMVGGSRRFPQRRDELRAQVVDLDRGESQALDAGDGTRLTVEAGERVARSAVAKAAEIHAGQHDLALALRGPPSDLGEDRVRPPA